MVKNYYMKYCFSLHWKHYDVKHFVTIYDKKCDQNNYEHLDIQQRVGIPGKKTI